MKPRSSAHICAQMVSSPLAIERVSEELEIRLLVEAPTLGNEA